VKWTRRDCSGKCEKRSRIEEEDKKVKNKKELAEFQAQRKRLDRERKK
jgi:hypothetical protein